MGKPIKIIISEEILPADLFTVYKTTIGVSNKEHTHINVHRKPTVGVFPIDSDKNIYLLKQYRYMFEDYLIEEVSGHIDDEETPIVAAKRELKEEAGIIAKSWKNIIDLKGGASVVKSSMSVFVAEDLEFSHSEPEEDEFIEVLKMPIDEAIKLVFDKKITTASTIVGLLLIKNHYNNRI